VRVRALLLLTACGLCLGFAPLSARAADIDLPAYVQRLTTARDALTQAQSLAGPPRDAAIRRAQDALAGIDGVTVDGKRYPAPHGDAVAALRRSPPDIERAGIQLTALRDLLASEQVAPPDAQARQKLDTILSDRAFHEAEPNLVQKQVTRIRSWIGAQLRRIFRPIDRARPPEVAPGTPGAGPFARFLALLGSPAFLILILLILAALIVVFAIRRRGKRAGRSQEEQEIPPRTAAEWRQHADMLAERGEYRAAVRALFLGTLTDLDERRLIIFDPTLTDREYLREAQRQQGWLAEPLRPFVRLIEAIVYADAPCRAAEYDRARGFTDDIRQLVTAPQGGAS
jgi:hypothetical protein